MLIIMVSMDL